MDYFMRRSSSISDEKEVVEYKFQIDDEVFTIPATVMRQFKSSGLTAVVRQKGFKEMPPTLPRSEGNIVLTGYREAFSFGLMVKHIKGENPLVRASVYDLPNMYMKLRTECLYWEMDNGTVQSTASVGDSFEMNSTNVMKTIKLPGRLWTSDAWCDEHCFHPLAGKDVIKKKKVQDYKLPDRVQVLVKTKTGEKWKESDSTNNVEDLISEYIDKNDYEKWEFYDGGKTGMFSSDGKKFICKFGYEPCILYGNFGKAGDQKYKDILPCAYRVSNYETIIIWNLHTFVHIKVVDNKETSKPQEICRVYSFPPQPASWFCFHPTNGMPISSHVGPIPHVYCFGIPEAAVIKFTAWGAIVIQKTVIIDPATNPTAVAAKIMRLKNPGNVLRPYEISFSISDEEQGSIIEPLSLEHVKDFDIVDKKSEGTAFQLGVLAGGSLGFRYCSVPTNATAPYGTVFGLSRDKTLSPNQDGVSIRAGGPTNQSLLNFYILGEFLVKNAEHYEFPEMKELYKYHTLPENRLSSVSTDTEGCTIQ